MLTHLCAAIIALVPLPKHPSDLPWPTREWPRGEPIATKLLDVVDVTDPLMGETRAVVIVHHGRIVAERYRQGFDARMPLLSWSVAKSVTQALLGVAVKQGLVDIDRPMGNPRWSADDARAKITWRQWINMVDGQAFHEIGRAGYLDSDVAQMLFSRGRLDVAGYAAGLPLVHTPGTHWTYNSAGINLITDALANVVAPNATAEVRRAKIAALMKDELFAPIGMTTALAEYDSKGTFVGSAFVYATAQDFARFGYLYLRDGVWGDQRVLPEGWVDFARTKMPAKNVDFYGAGFWIAPQRSFMPADIFFAEGHQGQFVVISPARDLVIVRLGKFDHPGGGAAVREWLAQLVKLF